MKEYYRCADLFVLPSTGEPASISQLEAMAYSLPVVCSDKNGTACVVEDGINGYLFKDNDEKSLYGAIDKIVVNKEMRNRMSIESFGLINSKYQIDQYIDKLHDLMRR